MADVKAKELSHDEWQELLRPYGWADITVTAPAVRFRTEHPPGVLHYAVRVMLWTDQEDGRDEWAWRSALLDQARQAVEAVRAKGYLFMDAPRIEFGGQYRYRVDRGAVPEWSAEAELSFRVHAT